MNKMRELFIIMGALSVLVAAIWFWAYLRPSQARAEQLRIDIINRETDLNTQRQEAEDRNATFARMTARYEELIVRWEDKSSALPDVFDDTEVLRHIQRVLYPHVRAGLDEDDEQTKRIELTFGFSEMREDDLLYSTVVDLKFETTYWQFLSILYNLVEQENLGNRVVNYRIGVELISIEEFTERIDGLVYLTGTREDDIPMHIMEQFREDFSRAHATTGRGGEENAPPPMEGLYLLTVEMQVEYLSIRPGLTRESDLRIIWELEDLLLAETYSY
jgi:hypothetical protein